MLCRSNKFKLHQTTRSIINIRPVCLYPPPIFVGADHPLQQTLFYSQDECGLCRLPFSRDVGWSFGLHCLLPALLMCITAISPFTSGAFVSLIITSSSCHYTYKCIDSWHHGEESLCHRTIILRLHLKPSLPFSPLQSSLILRDHHLK